jgi:hypothetical protein
VNPRAALLALVLIPQLSGCVLVPWAVDALSPPTPLMSGQRVRVYLKHQQPRVRTATLMAVGADGIVLRPALDSTRVAVPFAELRGLEISRGVGNHALDGAVGGAVLGALVGTVVGTARACSRVQDCRNVSGSELPLEEGLWIVFSSVCGGMLIGGGGGLLVGSLVRTERWENVPLRHLRGVRVGASAQAGGRLGLGASFRF